MMKKGLLLLLVAAFGMGAVMVVYAADEPRGTAAPDMKNMKTLQGTLVDLQMYMDARAMGKDPSEAAKWTMKEMAGKAKEALEGTEAGKAAAGADEARKTEAREKMAGMTGNTGSSSGEGARVKGFLVTEKDWLTKMTPGRELYVVFVRTELRAAAGEKIRERMGEKGAMDSADASAMNLDNQVGTQVKLTGRVFDEDGVRAISITKIEPVSGTPTPAKP